MLKLFKRTETAEFLTRPNRFLVECRIGKKKVQAHLPNPGRLQELLLPGSLLTLVKNSSPHRKTQYTAVAVEREGRPVFLHTHLTNRAAHTLIDGQRIPGLKGYKVLKPEITIGKSRFDFLLKKGREDMVLEVKSCTLFGKKIAMFPDAVTERGRRHIMELAHLSRNGVKAGVLFMVHRPDLDYFLPDYHTDPDFTRTLLDVRKDLLILPVSVKWGKDLTLGNAVHRLEIPWGLVEKEAHDSGSYLVVMRLKKRRKIRIGQLGIAPFEKGYYIYTGSARRGLAKRIRRHETKRKKLFWHIDYLREHAEFCTALPVRSSSPLECEMARAVKKISDGFVPGFGSSDCSCGSHLFRFREDPLQDPAFIQTLQYFRIDRLRV